MKKLTHIVLFFFIAAQVFAQQKSEMAPISQKFIDYQEKEARGNAVNKTANGYYLGERPAPVEVNFSHLKFFKAPKTIPTSYDLRTESDGNWISPVRDQGLEGACWAFATYGAVESYILRQGSDQFDFSEQNLATCHNFDWTPSDGGNYYLSAAYLSRHSGPISESDDPYTLPDNPTCVSGFTPAAFVQQVRFLPGIGDATYSADLIKQTIMDNGAVYVNLCQETDYYNSSDYTYYYNGTDGTNHAVLLVGWDDSKVVTGGSTASPTANGAWIIRNSWGPSWGESGFYYISYEDTKALSSIAIFPSDISFSANEVVYNYDELGYIGSTGYSAETAYGLIKYTAAEAVKLTKLGIYIPSAGATVDFTVYSTFNGTTVSGELGSLTGQTCDYPGFHTFDLSAEIAITNGSDFYIQAKVTTPGYNYPLATEYVYDGYSSNVTVESGKCWDSGNGSTWWAVGSDTDYKYDLCIKAYANKTTLAADFEADITTGNAPLSVQFNNLSTGNITSWSWDFNNDGTPESTEQNPSYTYTENGTYTVALTVSDGSISLTETKTDFITVSSNYLMHTGTITTNDGVFYDAGGNDAAYSESMNDTLIFYPATTGSLLKFDFTSFATESGYDYLYIYNGSSTDSTLLYTLDGNKDPFSFYATNSEGAITFVFTSDGSNQLDGWVANISTISDLSTFYSMKQGSYTVNNGLFVDDGGIMSEYSNSKDDTLTFYPSSTGEKLSFSFSAYNTEASYDYLYAFDGTNTEATLIGTYNGTEIPTDITATNTDGAITFVFHSDGNATYSGWEAEISMSGQASTIVADFTSDVTSGDAPLAVQFTDASTGTPTTWTWDFDNNGTTDATAQNPSYTYNTAGTYTVKLTVGDGTSSDEEIKTGLITVNESTDYDVWEPITSGTTSNLNSIMFIDDTHGWIAGAGNSLLRTTDAGLTWTPASSGIDEGMNDVFFIDENNGWAVAANKVYKSTDGGDTWSSQEITESYYVLFTIYFTDADTGYTAGQNIRYKTTDGGTTWIAQTNADSYVRDIQFVNGIGYQLDYRNFYKTTDGDTWSNQHAFTDNAQYAWNMHFIDNDTIYVAGDYFGGSDTFGYVYKSTDEGQTWTRHNFDKKYTGGVHFINSENGYVVGGEYSEAVIWKTTDSGNTWTVDLDETSKRNLSDITFISPSIGIAIGGGGLIYRIEKSTTEPSLMAAFSADVTSGTNPLTVQFTDESTGTPTSWAWTFEGGTPNASTDQNPTNIVYNTVGIYDATLVATNADGSDSETKTDYISVANSSNTETENNDTYLLANTVSLDGSINGSIDNVSDYHDWFKITIPYDGALTCMGIPNATFDISMNLYDVDGESYIKGCFACGSTGENDTLTYPNLKAGTYYLDVNGYGDGTYTLKNSFIETTIPTGNDTEPNDVYTQALTLAIDESTTGHLLYYSNGETDNRDWYKITIPYDGALTFVGIPDASLDISMSLYDVDGVSYIKGCFACGGTGENDTLTYPNLKAGTYFVELSGYGYGSYTFKNSFIETTIPTGNDAEPNDVVTEALTLTLDGSTTGHLLYYSNLATDYRDWYKITIPYDGALTFVGIPDASLDISMSLYDVDGVSYIKGCFACGGTGENDTLTYPNLKAGTYFVELSGYGYGSYTFKNSFIETAIPTGNDVEPNNVYTEANTIGIDEVTTGHLKFFGNGTTDNDDWYKITIVNPGSVDFITIPETTLDLTISLYDTNGSSYLEGCDVCGGTGENDTLSHEFTNSGTYYLYLSGYGYGSYTLKTELEENIVEANFTVDIVSGDAPLSVQFTDESTGDATAWSWDFNNDGEEDSDLQNPSYLYTEAGTYSVKLTVSNDNSSDEMVKLDYIDVLSASCNDLSTDYIMNFEATDDISDWKILDENSDDKKWGVFADIGINATQCAGYQYSSANVANDWLITGCFDLETGVDYEVNFYYKAYDALYTEKLKVFYGTTQDASMNNLIVDLNEITNDDFIKSTNRISVDADDSYYFGWYCYSDADKYAVLIDSVVIKVADPIIDLVADFSSDITSGDAPLFVQFTDESTGEITTWSWNFGDGGTSTEQSPYYTYSQPGDYSVSLTVENATSNDTEIKTDYITVSESSTLDVWEPIPSGTTDNLESVMFIDDNYGWIAGWNNTLLRTTDGGLTWTPASSGIDEYAIKDVFFIDKNIGWAVGANKVFTSTDGGDTWSSQEIAESYQSLFAIYFTDDNTGFASGSAGIRFITTDGGSTWTSQNIGVDNIFNIQFNNGTGYQVGYRHFYKTSDSETWTDEYTFGENEYLWNLHFVNSSTGFIAGDQYGKTDTYGYIYNTTDGGGSWTQHLFDEIYAMGVFFLTEDYGYVVGGAFYKSVIWKTANGGDSWEKELENESTGYLQDITFISPTIGFAVGRGGAIYRIEKSSNPLPVANFFADLTSGIPPLTVQFTDESTGNPTSWSWDFDNDGVEDSNEPNPEYVYETLGEYTVSLTVTNDEGSDTEIKENYIEVTLTGINQDQVSTLSCYPNPVSTNLHIECKQGLNSIKMYDMQGKVVYTNDNIEGNTEHIIDVSSFESGIYYVSSNNNQFAKIVVE